MAAPKRTKAQMLEDYSFIGILSLRGETQDAIAKALNKIRKYKLTQQTISNDLKAIDELYAKNAVVDINTERGRLKAHYENLIAECYKAWERSQKDAVVITEEEVPIKAESASVRLQRKVQTTGQVGDKGFITEIRQLLAEYRDLFGLQPAKAIKLEGEVGVIKGYVGWTPEGWDQEQKKKE